MPFSSGDACAGSRIATSFPALAPEGATMSGSTPWIAAVLLAQAMAYPAGDRAPTLEETRSSMGIASTATVRGQRDAVGFASTAEQMRVTWELSAEGPAPEKLGTPPAPGGLAVLSPHDD